MTSNNVPIDPPDTWQNGHVILQQPTRADGVAARFSCFNYCGTDRLRRCGIRPPKDRNGVLSLGAFSEG
jgi:hypothetical protein